MSDVSTRAYEQAEGDCHEGCRGFVAYIDALAVRARSERRSRVWLMLRLARDCANVDLRLLLRPVRFWRSLREPPPVRFGPAGFRRGLVDDSQPARHYTAFLMVGFFLPYPLALLFCRLWERAEAWAFGSYSPRDVKLGELAVRHGCQVRRGGPEVLPQLVQDELCTGNDVQERCREIERANRLS